MSTLSPDKKRTLFFNVKDIFEVSDEEFDNNWWPLISNVWTQYNSCKLVNGDSWKVFACRLTKHRDSSIRQEGIPIEKRRKTTTRSYGLCHAKIKITRLFSSKMVRIERHNNSPNHTHTIKDNDIIKRSEAVRTLIKQEATKNYPSTAIVSAIKEYATNELDLGNSVQDLKWREVANIRYKLRGSIQAQLVGSANLNADILEAVSFLNEQGYYVEHYNVTKRSTKGIVFAHPKQFEKLQYHGWLTLIDSTHKTNKHDWRFFTLYIHDQYGCWNVGSHFFVSNEDSETIINALKII